MHLTTPALLFVLAVLTADASQIKVKPNIKGRVFPANICPSLAVPPQLIRFDPGKYTSGKSPYTIPSPQQVQQSAQGCPGCQLVHMHLISRHGTRYPTEGNLYSTILLEKKLEKANPADPALGWVKTWKSPLDPVKNGALHEVGWDDLRKLGQRDQQRYKSFLTLTPQLGSQIDFRTTAIDRSQESGDAYMETIFGKGNPNTPKKVVLPRNQDVEMRPWEVCPKYKVAKVSPKMAKMKQEREAAFMQQLTERIAKVLGLPAAPPKPPKTDEAPKGPKPAKAGKADKADKGAKPDKAPKEQAKPGGPLMLETKDVSSMYTICMSSVSMCFQRGQFCNLFTEEEMRKLNYFKDMTYYYVHGPGNPVNVQMSGPLIAAIRNEMSMAIANPAGPKMHMRFNHAETVIRLSNGLNIYDKPDESGKNPIAFNQARDLPFMGNIHLELWRGGAGGSDGSKKKKKLYLERRSSKDKDKKEKKKEEEKRKKLEKEMKKGNIPNAAANTAGPTAGQYYVRMLVNEQPRQLRGCSAMFCPFLEFLKLTDQVAAVNLNEVCKLSPEEEASMGAGGKKKKGKALDTAPTGPVKPLDLSNDDEPIPNIFEEPPAEQAAPQGA